MRTPAALLATILLTSCVTVGGQADEPTVDLAPSFAPATPTATPGGATPSSEPPSSVAPSPAPPPAATPAQSPDEATGPAAATDSPAPTAATPTAAPRTAMATVSDAPDDRTTRLGGSPDWADLAAADLTRVADQFTLRIELGDAAPTAAPDGNHTMNVASFFDLDGDGRIDVEVWANLSDGGWDTAQYDNRGEGAARFSGDDDVDVAVADGRLVLAFPASALGGSWSFRWSLGSEYGRYEELGTRLMARDDMPDEDQPAAFPAG